MHCLTLCSCDPQEFEQAKTYYQKSLSEHRTPETNSKLSEVEKIIKQRNEMAYRDPEKAEEERAKGNELFKAGGCSLTFFCRRIDRSFLCNQGCLLEVNEICETTGRRFIAVGLLK